MKSSNKKWLQKIELQINAEPNSSRGIMIYNPDYDQEKAFAETSFVVALPDNRLDKELTQKIEKTFVVL